MARAKITFPAFFAIWADERGWEVPDVHWRAVDWLGRRGDLAVLRCFRGFGKSTILAVYNAWRYYDNPAYRILHQSESDGTAYKTSRDTQNVLNRHPLTAGMFKEGGVEQWWVRGNDDPRNASMYSRGILSNVTSARCDEAQNDDVEVPRNTRTPEAREQLEYRLGEQNFIMVPGARQLFIGTPHSHETIYDKMEALGADCLTIPLFGREHRIEMAGQAAYQAPFRPEYVFAGIGKGSRLLEEGRDYLLEGDVIRFPVAPGVLIDLYADCAWPERFTRDDLQKRRRKTKTVNYWDSQYQLHSRPVHEIRLNPAAIPLYDVEPTFTRANKVLQCWLGKARIVGASLRWDPASGKLNSDTSALALILQDERGCRYWHRAIALTGKVAEYDDAGKTILGGQVHQICAVVAAFGVRRIKVETNGIGGFAPAVLKAALKQQHLPCAVDEEHASSQKNKRILESFEPMMQSRMLWAHVSVADGPAWPQMREWVPTVQNQPDDHLDVAAGAINDAPERLAQAVQAQIDAETQPVGPALTTQMREEWRPSSGVFEAELEI